MNALPAIPSRDWWGPWRPDIEPPERLARLRSLRVVVRLLCGPRGADLERHLRDAETDRPALLRALDALDRLAPLDRRRVLASYAAVMA